MFDKEYSFRGSHADKVIVLTADFNENKNQLFSRNLDVYLAAPIIGFLYGRKSPIEKGDKTTKIFLKQLLDEQQNLMFNYRLIMLLDKNNESDFDKRVDKAFRLYGKEEAKSDELLYEDYVRGGVDVLYEKLIESATSADDYIKNLYDFIEEFDERFNISAEGIADLCRLARS